MSPRGDKTTFDFMVIRLTRLSGASIPTSLKVSTVKGLKFTIDSTSVSSVISDSTFKFVPC